jgi:hypothetical protein
MQKSSSSPRGSESNGEILVVKGKGLSPDKEALAISLSKKTNTSRVNTTRKPCHKAVTLAVRNSVPRQKLLIEKLSRHEKFLREQQLLA